ncbi:MAG: hypothetical protein H0W61_09515 [Bacteroidetes bacterium]|nr:hypothetical protein [Bacteroidota bacterium]
MITSILEQSPPRAIDYNHDLFKKNRSRIKSVFLGSLLIIPLMAVLFYFKFDDLMAGVLWGIGLTSFFELIGVAMMINAKKSVELFRDGAVTQGLVDSIKAPPDKQGNTIMVLKVTYADNLGVKYSGNASMMGKASDVDKKAGDPVTVVYKKDAPQTFAIYTPGIGISMSRSKQA